MFHRQLRGLEAIEKFSGHNTGEILDWILYIDWPGYQRNGVWLIAKRALKVWMRKHEIPINPEPATELNRPKRQIKLPRRRW